MLDTNVFRNSARLGGNRTLQGRRPLDLAQGVLIGLRRYSADAAFDELISVAHKHDVSVSAVASALVALASGAADDSGAARDALAVAHLAWGDLLHGSVGDGFGCEGVGKTVV